METTLNEQAEKIKNSINDTVEESKETIRKIIDSNARQIGAALDSNKQIVDSIKEKLQQQEINMDNAFIDTLRKTFGKSIELSEDAIDSIIEAYSKQIQFSINYNIKLLDAIKDSGNKGTEKLLQLITENFEAGRQVTIDNMNSIVDSYNKHANLALNFNKKIRENISDQMENLHKLRENNLKLTSGWASDWWKSS